MLKASSIAIRVRPHDSGARSRMSGTPNKQIDKHLVWVARNMHPHLCPHGIQMPYKLTVRVSMGGGNYLFSNGPHTHLPLTNPMKRKRVNAPHLSSSAKEAAKKSGVAPVARVSSSNRRLSDALGPKAPPNGPAGDEGVLTSEIDDLTSSPSTFLRRKVASWLAVVPGYGARGSASITLS
ncbi:hypothetical protein EVAR_25439_1 [Eumeta japonica]|uniref:Uncharacterized protein n=1 Tax=Eumeta variegata TaxID=151549 RepID=A0A4C1V6G8_EUMVA|nr:hypothetical protein EVAR_25439_1 [Eumeta japonica]